MIKGKSHHVMPNDSGWTVVDEASQMFTQHFDTQEEAMAYATQCARECEGDVLIHATPCDSAELSTVPLPQREVLPGQAHAVLFASSSVQITQHSQERKDQNPDNRGKSDYDPMLGYDEYYFEI